MRNLTDFPLFKRLPVEIQLAIWKAAIPPPQPTVYPVTARVQPKHKTENGHRLLANKFWQTHLDNAVKGRRSSSHFVAALSSLLRCCRLSSQVAIAAYKRHELKFPLSVRRLRHKIDGACDLPMFYQGWQEECHLAALHYRDRAPRRTLHNFSVLWPGPEVEKFWAWNGLRHILALWKDLKTFYVIVDPEHLVPKPWRPEGYQNWRMSEPTRRDEILSIFLHHYRQDYEQQEPNVFYYEDRKVFEVPPDIVAEAGTLNSVGELLFDAREILNPRYDKSGRPKIRCLILTWKKI